jgi:hypothetical protein
MTTLASSHWMLDPRWIASGVRRSENTPISASSHSVKGVGCRAVVTYPGALRAGSYTFADISRQIQPRRAKVCRDGAFRGRNRVEKTATGRKGAR